MDNNFNMKNHQMLILIVLSCFIGLSTQAQEKILFWDQPQYDGNSFNRLPPDEAYFHLLMA